MPAAPLFYTPIMQAQIRSIPVGESTLGAIEDAQLRFSKTDGPNGPTLVPETLASQQAAQGEQALQVAGTVSNIMGLVDGRKGAQLTRVTFAADDDAFVVNRTRTYIDDHPELL